MQFIGILYFTLAISSNQKILGYDILPGATFYYGDPIDDESSIRTTNLNHVIGSRVKNLVIELSSTYYVTTITIHITEGDPRAVSFSAIVGEATLSCREAAITAAEQRFNCFLLTRYILFRGNVTLRLLRATGHDSRLDNYLGCFKPQQTRRDVLNATSLVYCFSRCPKFYGLKSPTDCICIGNLTEMASVQLNLCSVTRGHFELLGREDYYAVFSRSRLKKNEGLVELSWNCIWFEIACPTCFDGRTGKRCEDISCSENNGNCDDMECQSMIADGLNRYEIAVCACRAGFMSDDSLNCIEIDECISVNPCTGGAQCINTVGSYTCACDAGFYINDGGRCVDIDECSMAATCDINSTNCVNKNGGYECICKNGFTAVANSYICKDIDECASVQSLCPKGISCVNLPGSYNCLCPANTKIVKYLYYVECEDVDECLNIHVCNATISVCLNIKASYVCICLPGYVNVDNVTCIVNRRSEDISFSLTESTETFTTASYEDVETQEFGLFHLFYIVFIIVVVFVSIVCLASTQMKTSPSRSSTLSVVTTVTK